MLYASFIDVVLTYEQFDPLPLTTEIAGIPVVYITFVMS
jgi:hypothetical protein